MPASVVQPEYGPTLPEALSPRLRRPLAIAAGAVLVLFLVWLVALRGGSLKSYVHHGALTFNFTYDAPLRKVPPHPGEYVRLEHRRNGVFIQSFAVSPVRLAPYTGDVNGTLPVMADAFIRRASRRYPGFRLAEEGRTRVVDAPGYTFAFRARLGKRTLFGRIVLLPVPKPGTRDAVAMELLGTPSAGVGTAGDVGAVSADKQPYRSFRFGTEGA
jgi:hypothetical protein